jgi:hypothetical protein
MLKLKLQAQRYSTLKVMSQSTKLLTVVVYILTLRMEVGITDPENTSLARQRHGKHVSEGKGIVGSGVFYAVRAEAI